MVEFSGIFEGVKTFGDILKLGLLAGGVFGAGGLVGTLRANYRHKQGIETGIIEVVIVSRLGTSGVAFTTWGDTESLSDLIPVPASRKALMQATLYERKQILKPKKVTNGDAASQRPVGDGVILLKDARAGAFLMELCKSKLSGNDAALALHSIFSDGEENDKHRRKVSFGVTCVEVGGVWMARVFVIDASWLPDWKDEAYANSRVPEEPDLKQFVQVVHTMAHHEVWDTTQPHTSGRHRGEFPIWTIPVDARLLSMG